MRAWKDSTFVFVSTNATHEPGGPEDRMLAAAIELVRLGATVVFLCMRDNPVAEAARKNGIQVAPYVLDKWNIVRSRSRLRKFLRRYDPVAAHSTGLEADLLLRWAARPLDRVRVVHTLAGAEHGPTRRSRPIDALFRRFDLAGVRGADAVFAETVDVAVELHDAGVPAAAIVDDVIADTQGDASASVQRHINLYRSFMAS